MTFKDRTYCGSPHCTNACGRKMSQEDLDLIERLNGLGKFVPPVAYAYFCHNPKENTNEGI